MKTTDLFKSDRSAKKINESIEKTFGKRLDFASFDLPKLEDARNKLRTQISQVRSTSGFNETVENEALTQAQWMLDAINAEIMEREEFIADPSTASVEEGHPSDIDKELRNIAKSGDEEQLIDAMSGLMGGELQDAIGNIKDEILDSMDDEERDRVIDDEDRMAELIMDKLVAEYSDDDFDSDETDDNYALASAGHGSDEDYGDFGYDESADKSQIPAYKRKQQGVSESDPSGLLSAAKTMNRSFIITADLAEGGRKQYRVRAQSERVAREKFAQHANQAKIVSVEEEFKEVDLGQADARKTTPAGKEEQEKTFSNFRKRLKKEKEKKISGPEGLAKLKKDLGMESAQMEKAPPGAKAERMVKHIKKGYAKDGKLTDKERSIAYATAWKQHNKEKNESIESGEDMTTLREGEVQQASAIVTAKTMVDRVSRWIEELSGMENDTLLQLGDSIRDEMSQEQAKSFISQVAPAIQQALESLKGTRETLATGVRMLTGEEQGAEMLGAEPAAAPAGEEELGAVEPDAMNAEPEVGSEDEFAAADAAVGGVEAAGREQRESIEYSNRLLKVLAG